MIDSRTGYLAGLMKAANRQSDTWSHYIQAILGEKYLCRLCPANTVLFSRFRPRISWRFISLLSGYGQGTCAVNEQVQTLVC
ncbi:MAG TPA: hypothetical protein PK239_09275 [Chitinophagales bacterium]|nr:hypothetical protein [Chitinophagales bacterium]